MNDPANQLRAFRRSRKKLYDSIGTVTSAVLGGQVHFTAEGFNHLLYKKRGKARNVREQALKLQWVKEAPVVVRNATTIRDMRVRTVGRKGREKEITQIAIVCRVKRTNVRVVVERMRAENHYRFVSVMPEGKTWRRRRRRT